LEVEGAQIIARRGKLEAEVVQISEEDQVDQAKRVPCKWDRK